MIYKVIIERTVFVEADNAEEAEDMVFDGHGIFSDERIVDVKRSSRREAGNIFRDALMEGE